MSRHFQMLGDLGPATYRVSDDFECFEKVQDQAENWLIPGLVDNHIHGGFGFDFMNVSSQVEIADWCDQLRSLGYEALLPTTVTAPPEAVERALELLPDHPMIHGFHLEGPFISDRFPGAQPKASIVGDLSDLSPWEDVLNDPRLRLITLAPELPGALSLIRDLTSRGVVVSLGHTNATYAECSAAFQAGARQTTHTYNAMRPLHHREAGTVGFALNSDVSAELIYDRLHVGKEAASILFRCKAHDQVIAVSDATMAAGLGAGQIEMWGFPAHVKRGEVRLEDGTLAGSAITLLDALRNLWLDFGPEVAIRACCINPRRTLKIARPSLYIEITPDLEIVRLHEAKTVTS